MAETGFGLLKLALLSAAAGFAFGEVALLAVKPTLTEDGDLMSVATLAAEHAGSTGVGVVTACFLFTSALISLGCGFLLAYLAAMVLSRVGDRMPGLVEMALGTCVGVGAVAVGLLGGIIPPWAYIGAQCVVVVVVYSYTSISQMTRALLIIFTTCYASVTFGRMGFIFGLFIMGLAIALFCAFKKVLRERIPQKPEADNSCRLFDRLLFYCVAVAILGFLVGLGAGGSREESELNLMLESVLWVAFLFAGLFGAGLGTATMVGMQPIRADIVSLGAAVTSSLSLRAILQASSFLGTRGILGGMLGVTVTAGVSFGAVSIASKQVFGSRKPTLVVLGSVVVGVLLAMLGPALKIAVPTIKELITVNAVAALAFLLGAPRSPFNKPIYIHGDVITGLDLIRGLGIESITGAAAPIGTGALGAAVLGTAALGRLGTVGVLVAILLAVGSSLITTTSGAA